MFSGLILAHPRLVGITLRAEAPQSFEVPLRSLGRRRESLRPGQRRPSGNRNTGGRRSVGTRNHTPVDVGTLPDILCLVWPSFRLNSGSKFKMSVRILKILRVLLLLRGSTEFRSFPSQFRLSP